MPTEQIRLTFKTFFNQTFGTDCDMQFGNDVISHVLAHRKLKLTSMFSDTSTGIPSFMPGRALYAREPFDQPLQILVRDIGDTSLDFDGERQPVNLSRRAIPNHVISPLPRMADWEASCW